jgi:hypothetical protein
MDSDSDTLSDVEPQSLNAQPSSLNELLAAFEPGKPRIPRRTRLPWRGEVTANFAAINALEPLLSAGAQCHGMRRL